MPCVSGGDVWGLVGSSSISRWLHKTAGAGSLHGNPKMCHWWGDLPNILVNKVLYNYLSPSLPGCASWAHEGEQTCHGSLWHTAQPGGGTVSPIA